MNSAEVLRRLCREKKEWQSFGTDPYVAATIQGIALCITHVKMILREQLNNERIRYPRISRLHARYLYRSIEVALHRLKTGDGVRAIQGLEKAILACNKLP